MKILAIRGKEVILLQNQLTDDANWGEVGKAFLVCAKEVPGKTYRRLVGDLVERVFGGNSVALVNSLFETRPPTNDELDELQDMLELLVADRLEPADRQSFEGAHGVVGVGEA